MTIGRTRAASALAMIGATALLSGCLGPTYGTGKSAGTQLFDDLDGMLALGSTNKQDIDYSPRAELVRPTNRSVLPQPQEAASAANSPNWPESPEARSARIRAAADAQSSDGAIPPDQLMADKEGISEEQKARNTVGNGKRWAPMDDRKTNVLPPDQLSAGRDQFKKRLAEAQQGSPAQRKYLSEPPLAYRQPAATATAGDPGEDEEVKERRMKGKDQSLLSKLAKLNPFDR
ncbi:hypothetical protein [Aureimonas leprariae]|uniref:Lipoprotein n=1 Tax=Plantimonas leprariae TaxID=2615207 RepID=A0A7V7PT06_9HYPH|nr:hypothetical protein [Aureimonas leprariae]KAB0682604.1 hypothetical protein F6X38_00480 [Aureimonas leprariae]